MDERIGRLIFGVFNEIGIIDQLATTLFEARMPKGLLAGHFGVLNNLTRVRDGRTPLELAQAFQVPKTTMSHTLAGLEKRGLVELRPNPRDGRSKCVWLTQAGRDLRESLIAEMAPDMAMLAERFDVTRLEAVLPVLEDLRAVLDAARD